MTLVGVIIISVMYQLSAFKEAAHQRGYGIGDIFKRLTRAFPAIVKRCHLDLGKQALQSGVQVLDEVLVRELM